MTDTTNHATCIVCGRLDYLIYSDPVWYCPGCWPTYGPETTEEKHELDRNL